MRSPSIAVQATDIEAISRWWRDMLPELHKSDILWANAIRTREWMLDPAVRTKDPVLHRLMEIGVVDWSGDDKRSDPIAESERFSASMVARLAKRVYELEDRVRGFSGCLKATANHVFRAIDSREGHA